MKQISFSITSKLNFFVALGFICFAAGCAKTEVFEKNTPISKHEWKYDLKPAFDFTITDTASQYNLYIVLRHTDAYRYNNIWLNVGTEAPGDSLRYQRFDLQLGTDATGWEGTGMGDIWEVRKSVTRGPFKFNKSGIYKFVIAQVMRENPLTGVMSVGVRVEKVK
ncbi:MAG: gliding motility lipoprotein GldH [Ferruginibacter sp.]|nr:gliding motility lipoprotein GldH [Ferruginibacter sp.]